MPVSPDVIGRGWSFPFDVNGRGGIAMVDGDEEIRQAILMVLRTRRGARVMRPEFGCRVWELLFAPNDASTWTLAGHHVREALGWWEPRVDVDDVRAEADLDDPAIVQIEVDYTVKATHDARSLVFPFYLIPSEEEGAAVAASDAAALAEPPASAPALPASAASALPLNNNVTGAVARAARPAEEAKR
jgi:uncharacterized protein